MVSSKLWINTLQRRILVGLWLLDTVSVSLLGLVVSGMVLRLSHFLEMMNSRGGLRKFKGLVKLLRGGEEGI